MKSFMVVAGLALTGSATAAPAVPPQAEPAPRVCAYAQMATAGLGPWGPARPMLPIDNVIHQNMDSFVLAKPEVRPLRTHQFVTPTQIRCKGKSADHISTTYGSGIARGEGTCAAINTTTLRLIASSLTAGERGRAVFDPAKVVVDADTLTQSGGEWTQEFPSTRVVDGVLHLRASTLLVEWNDPRYQDLPPAFRGNHYCTLIAPGHLKGVLLGEAI